MNMRPAVLRGLLLDAGPNLRICRRHIGETIQQRLEVQHRTADQQWNLFLRNNCRDFPLRIRTKVGGGVWFGRITDIYQAMRRHGQLGGSWLGGTDVHTAINQRGVYTDNLHRQMLPQGYCQVCLARCGRPHQKDDLRALLVRLLNVAHSYCPRINIVSRSSSDCSNQVGRPWLHWPLRSVASMSRSKAFISGMVRRRLARTEA